MRHTRTALARPHIIGHTNTGLPVWSLAGGADDTADDGADDGGGDSDDDGQADDTGDGDDDEAGDDADDDKPLGPKGEKALQAMKDRNRDLRRQLREARAAADKPKDQDGDDELDADQLRKQIRDELAAETARDRALDKVEVKAARKFQNPALVRRLLRDEADDLLDDQGNPDVEAITERLDELLKDEPYLAVTSATPSGSGDAGSRTPPPTPEQLTRSDLERMTAEQIVKAKAEGRLDDALSGRS